MYFAQKESIRKEGRFWQKEDFHTKGTSDHITTGTKQLQMSFYKFDNKLGTVYFMEWSHGVESWSGVIEWSLGGKCWSGSVGLSSNKASPYFMT